MLLILLVLAVEVAAVSGMCHCGSSCAPRQWAVSAITQCHLCREVLPHCSRCLCTKCDIFNTRGILIAQACDNGYYLKNGKCLPCQSYCQDCSSLSYCVTCANGFMSIRGQCILFFCEQMATETTCRKCKYGFCLSSDGRCYECSSLSNTCGNGYYVGADGTSCHRCAAPCLSCGGSATTCNSCLEGYELQGTHTCTIPSCIEMEGVACSTCKDGFYLSEDRMTCNPCSENCAACADSADACTICKDGMELDELSESCIPTYNE